MPHLLLDCWKGHAAHQGETTRACAGGYGGVTLLQESIFRGETSWIPAAFARRSIVLSAVWVLGWPLLLPGSSHSWPDWMLSLMASRVAWLALAARFARDAVFSAGDMEHYYSFECGELHDASPAAEGARGNEKSEQPVLRPGCDRRAGDIYNNILAI